MRTFVNRYKHPPRFSSARRIFLSGLIVLLCSGACAQQSDSPEPTTQTVLWEKLLNHPSHWYSSPSALQIAENMYVYQRVSGGWPKNIDMTEPIPESVKKELTDDPSEPPATIDNGATYTQLHFLANVIRENKDSRFLSAFFKGFDYLFKAQYPNGGWPQFYPLRKDYYKHITYNDDAMVGVLHFLKTAIKQYGFLDAERLQRAQIAVNKGIDCILKTQITSDGTLTVWCAQYDEKTLKPAGARTYELPSLSSKESVGIVRFLMEIENPSPEIICAVQGAISWLNQVKITGIRVVEKPVSVSSNGFDKFVVNDPYAEPIWVRFYLIGSNKPFFSDRDGKIYESLSDISWERRNEYGWLGYWPQELLERDYPKWQKKWAPEENVLRQVH